MPDYITTDPESLYELVPGATYFMDFDISSMSPDVRAHAPLDSIAAELVYAMRQRGHDLEDVVSRFTYPDIVRIFFKVDNPPPLIILISIAIAIVSAAIIATAYIGSTIQAVFLGLVRIMAQVVNIPFKVVEKAIQNPIPVIAIMIAVAIFILGRKL